MTELIADLRSEIAARRALIVVGSGVSIGATRKAQAASWIGLIRLGVERCLALTLVDAGRAAALNSRLRDSPSIEDLITTAEEVTQRLKGAGEGEFTRWLKETVGGLSKLSSLDTTTLFELSKLNVDIATTNYDDLLERHTDFKSSVDWTDVAGVLRTLRRQEASIIHLHGHWDNPPSVVLGIRSYEDILRDKAAEAVMRSLPMLRTLVFVGCGEGLKDPNFKKMIDWYQVVLDRAEHRHYRLVTDGEMEGGRVSQGIYDIAYGQSHDDLPAFLRSLRTPKTISVAPGSKVAISFNLDHWAAWLRSSAALREIAEGKIEAARTDPHLFIVAGVFEQRQSGIPIQAVSAVHGFEDSLHSFKAFLVDAMTVLVMDPGNWGHLKGLIKRVSASNQSHSTSFLQDVMDRLVQRYAIESATLLNANVVSRFIEAAIETFDKRDGDGLFKFVQYLAFSKARLDTVCLRALMNVLVRHEEAASNQSTILRPYLSKVKTLIGLLRFEVRRRDKSGPLTSPPVVTVARSERLGYEFDVLKTPITNLQWYEITGRREQDSISKPSHPFVFEMISATGDRLYASLASEVEVLLIDFQKLASGPEYLWDVPTAPEWLAIAGCEGQPYPWGSSEPTPDHANLRFGRQTTVLQPVGLCARGRSPSGADDCCGNVHEIVRVELHDEDNNHTFPKSFRLAGGCFQNEPAPCSTFRHFKPQSGPVETRRNVGIRLARFKKDDLPARKRALERFLESQKTSA